MTNCIEACKKKGCAPDIHLRNGCNQMYSCSHACKIRDLGVDEQTCKGHCIRTGQSGCFPTVFNYRFNLCRGCNRPGCSSWPSITECQIGCTNYGK